ncbi:MAG: nicotinate phosphoribosyltransferase [Candidatus Nitrospinota bacterium M3_3B_026]
MSVPPTPLVTDLYQLTMAQGYFREGMSRYGACFDFFFRHTPFNGGYVIFAGLSEALEFLEKFRFSVEDLDYLASLRIFGDDFLKHLGQMRFTGDVLSAPEGSPVFPREPVMRVTGPLDQLQLVETAVLNTVNFQSLIATKAARVCREAGEDNVMEFGARRAQGVDGALSAARAAYIGGVESTSNVHAGLVYGIPVRGTHSHSWVTAFENEIDAFRAFARVYPDNTILLVDTYDTLKSGMPSAIKVAKEMEREGHRLRAVRLDSGDLTYLSQGARAMLDEAGLDYVKIVGSGDLDENIIHDLNAQGARIDIYGVGTRLTTAFDEPALPGVYKMSAIRPPGKEWEMKLKIAEGVKKATLPGLKQVWRLYNGDHGMMADLVELDGAAHDFSKGVWGYHLLEDQKKFYSGISRAEPLLAGVMRGGKRTAPPEQLPRIREYAKSRLAELHPTYKRLMNPHVYKVSLGPELNDVTKRMREDAAEGL